jgi:hypothetical protein
MAGRSGFWLTVVDNHWRVIDQSANKRSVIPFQSNDFWIEPMGFGHS